MPGIALKNGVFVVDVEEELPTTPSTEILNICFNEYTSIRGSQAMSYNFIPMATHTHFMTRVYGKNAGMKFTRTLRKAPYNLTPLEIHIIKKIVKLTEKILNPR